MTPKLSAALFDVPATIAVRTSSSGSSGIDSTTSVMRMIDEVDPAAVVTGDRAEQRADHDLHDDGEQRDRERDARAEHEAREQVAAVLVRAEQVRGDAGRERIALPVDLVDEVRIGPAGERGERAREDRGQRHEGDDHAADQRDLVPAEAAPDGDA